MADEKEKAYEWQVGDLCTRSGEEHANVIYRVIDIEEPTTSSSTAFVKPVFSSLRKRPGHRTTTHSCKLYECTPMTLIDLGLERMRFESFIADETRRRSQ